MSFNPRDIFYTFDEPVTYKELRLHPIRMEHIYLMNMFSSVLLLEKNSISNNPELAVKAISMSYLEFLFKSSNKENNLIYLLDGLLRLVLNKLTDKNFEIKYDKDNVGKPIIKISGKTYNSSDFDELRKIISEQNMIDLPDERIQKNVRDKLEEAKKFRERVSGGFKPATLEEQIIALSLYTGWNLEHVKTMTVRKFFSSIRRANHMIMSNIYLTASMSGFVTFKDKSVLRGWLTDLSERDKYEDVKMSPESLVEKGAGQVATG